jgi:hypothetical protein
MKNFKNTGGDLYGLDLGELFTTAGGAWAAYNQSQQAQDAADIARANAEAALYNAQSAEARAKADAAIAAANAAAAKAAADSKGSTIKAYILPIAITGGIIIVGIATYFIFRNKNK